MRIGLLGLSGQDTKENLIVLEDYWNGSDAVYHAENKANKVFFCCDPDRSDEANKKKDTPDPRCDYLLVGKTDTSVRFIELKGVDKRESSKKCCSNTWEHGFHQLITTYHAYSICYESHDCFKMILCTSISREMSKGRIKNYKKYGYYKEIQNILKTPPKVLYRDDIDTV